MFMYLGIVKVNSVEKCWIEGRSVKYSSLCLVIVYILFLFQTPHV